MVSIRMIMLFNQNKNWGKLTLETGIILIKIYGSAVEWIFLKLDSQNSFLLLSFLCIFLPHFVDCWVFASWFWFPALKLWLIRCWTTFLYWTSILWIFGSGRFLNFRSISLTVLRFRFLVSRFSQSQLQCCLKLSW